MIPCAAQMQGRQQQQRGLHLYGISADSLSNSLVKIEPKHEHQHEQLS